jgi:transposase
MKKIVICGADVHENSMTTRIAVNKDQPQTRVFRYTRQGRQALFRHLKQVARSHGAQRMVMAYEASSLGFGLCDEAAEAGIACYVLAPTKMPQSEEQRKRKTDKRDAQKILEQLRGYLLAGNELANVWIPDPQLRDDRELVRMRLDLADKLTKCRTQVRTLLKRNKVQKPQKVGKAWTLSDRRWLKGLSQPQSQLLAGAGVALASLLRQIAALEEEVQALDQAVEGLAGTERYRAAAAVLVEQLTGVATLTAMVFLTELGDLRRFKNRKRVGAFMGVVPSSNESGEGAKDRKGHITRQGSARLRKVLCQGAWARVAFDRKESKVHARIVQNNPKKKKIATVACMRRLGVRMWHLALEAQLQAGVYESKDLPEAKRTAA